MNRGPIAVLVLLLAAAVAGCLGGDNSPEPTPTPEPTPAPPPSDDLPANAELAQTGRWLAPFEGGVPAVNMIVLNDGRVLYWSGVEANTTDGGENIVFFDVHPTDAQSRVLDLSGDVLYDENLH